MTIETVLADAFALSLPIWLAIEEIHRNLHSASSRGRRDVSEKRTVARRTKRLAKTLRATGCIAMGVMLVLGWPGIGPAFAERASDRTEDSVAEFPKPLGNTSKAVLLCDRKSSEKPIADLVEHAFEKDRVMPISSYDDDPFAQDSIVECMDPSGFDSGPDGRPILSNARVLIQDEPVIFLQNETGNEEEGEFKAFANNPWPLPTSNVDGSFRFLDEPRFPLHEIERGADGRPILINGLQVWKPRDLHRGMTTTFEAANKVKDAAEDWSGRHLAWGVDEILEINTHAFIDFNAIYSPSARMLFFGVVGYRLPPTPLTPIKIFEVATSWEAAAHETGHAVHHTSKPNIDVSDVGFRTWSESFGDQFAMWTSPRSRPRPLAPCRHQRGPQQFQCAEPFGRGLRCLDRRRAAPRRRERLQGLHHVS